MSKQNIEIFLLTQQQVGIRTKTANLFIVEIIKQIPFSTFDGKRGVWKIPIWELPELLEKLKMRPSALPQDVLDAYRQVLEIERKTAVVYMNLESGIISAISRDDAYKNVKRFLRKCTNRKHELTCEYGQFLKTAEKYQVIVRASKEAKNALDPKKFAERFVSRVKVFFPSFPEYVNATVVSVSYVKQTAVCDVCKEKKTQFFLIKNEDTGTVVRACTLCSAVILDPKTFKKWKTELNKVVLKNNMRRAKEHKGLLFRLFKAKPVLLNKFPRRQRDLNKIRREVSRVLQSYDREVAESHGTQESQKELPEIKKDKDEKE